MKHISWYKTQTIKYYFSTRSREVIVLIEANLLLKIIVIIYFLGAALAGAAAPAFTEAAGTFAVLPYSV
jgi:hypothetical protein